MDVIDEQGAGRYPTANSVVTDIIHVCTHQYDNSTIWRERQEVNVHSAVPGTFVLRVGEEWKELPNPTLEIALKERDEWKQTDSSVLLMMKL